MKGRLICQVAVLGILLFGGSYPGYSQQKEGGLKEVRYVPTSDIFPNPERGFMHLYSTSSEGEPLNAAQLVSLKKNNITLVHRMYYLEKFKDKPLSDAQLALMYADLKSIRQAGLKIILAFAYTGQGDTYNEKKGEDAPYTIIEQHLNQLKPFFTDNQDVIAFVQAGFIGPWGEWHSSTNGLTTTYYTTKVLDKMLSVIPPEIMVQVRTPKYKKDIFGAEPVSLKTAYTSEKSSRVGHYNDCFMASVDDYGTYTNVDADMAYISNEGLYVPAGGETCPPVPKENAPDCTVAAATMKLLRWTYLNLDWYRPTIDSWISDGCFNEFQRVLGYRLALVNGMFPDRVDRTGVFKFELTLANKGYAPLYHRKVTSLALKNKATGKTYLKPLTTDLRNCKPAATLVLKETVKVGDIPPGDYELYLKIADRSEHLQDRSDYSVRLANAHCWDREGGMNNLNHQLTIAFN